MVLLDTCITVGYQELTSKNSKHDKTTRSSCSFEDRFFLSSFSERQSFQSFYFVFFGLIPPVVSQIRTVLNSDRHTFWQYCPMIPGRTNVCFFVLSSPRSSASR